MTQSRIARVVAAVLAEMPAATRAAVVTLQWTIVLLIALAAPYIGVAVKTLI